MSKQPRTQRNNREGAALHERHRQVRATLADDLREEYGRRSARVNAGDTVEVLRGDFAGETAEVADVDLRAETIRVEDVVLETADGEEVLRPLDASNLRITALDLEDDRREERLEGGSDDE